MATSNDVKCYDSNKTMSFKVNDNNLSKRYTKIRNEIGHLMDIEFDTKLVYGDSNKYIKPNITT